MVDPHGSVLIHLWMKPNSKQEGFIENIMKLQIMVYKLINQPLDEYKMTT